MSSRSVLYGLGAVLAAIGFFAVGLAVAWLVFQPPRVSVTTAPPPSAPPADQAMLDQLYKQQRANKALEDQIAAARAKRDDVCRPGDRKTGEAPAGAPGQQQAAASSPPAKGATIPPAQQGELVPLLQAATVLVLAADAGGGFGHGSGYFIGPDLVVTNRHVVEDAAQGGQVVVTNRGLGKIHRAQILAMSQPGGLADFALLRVPGVDPAKMKTLAFGPEPQALSDVVAAGYPGVAVRADAKFRALLEGDLSAAPELVLTRGEVNAVQNRESPVPLVLHTAKISQGNSGGPLVDRCGRVVGINTFQTRDRRTGNSADFALSATAIVRFVQGTGARPDVRTDACR